MRAKVKKFFIPANNRRKKRQLFMLNTFRYTARMIFPHTVTVSHRFVELQQKHGHRTLGGLASKGKVLRDGFSVSNGKTP
jgi:hypothetical protein